MPKHKYNICTFNGRFKIIIDGKLFLMFSQVDFKGLYAYKDDEWLYGLDIYLAGGVTMEIYFKTKEVWLEILKLIDKNI